ncbi:MAG TPA: L-threonylcarbamoyladenylate synthase, partial [Dehalococcoidia bacterium]|nr:L-threonylcarbamoyladenylate synthase [Dehalococcoidia bacterium]
MTARLIRLGPSEATAEAERTLAAGGLVVLPTDTVYGVAADLGRPDAIARLYFAKERPDEKPIPLLLDGVDGLNGIAGRLGPAAERLIARFTPGGLTLVVPAQRHLPPELTGGRATVAVRIPDHDWTRCLIAARGGALPTTSANLSGKPPALTADEALLALGDRVDLVIDGGMVPGGVASTVVDVTGDR